MDSLLNQTLKDIEIICIDDGSTDNSLSILRRYEEMDSRVRVYTQNNKGAGAARNKGIELARGEYFSFLDSDDFFEPEMLELAYKASVDNNADIVQFFSDSYNDKNSKFEYIPNILKLIIFLVRIHFLCMIYLKKSLIWGISGRGISYIKRLLLKRIILCSKRFELLMTCILYAYL